MPKIDLEGVGIIDLPENYTKDQLHEVIAAARRASAPPREEPGLIRQGLQNVGGFMHGPIVGAIGAISTIPEAAGAVTDTDWLKDVGRWMRENEVSKYISQVPDWEKQADGTPNWGRQGGELLGNLGTMLIPYAGQIGKVAQVASLAARVLPRVGSLGLSAAQLAAQVSQDVDRQRDAGMQIAPEDAQQAAIESLKWALPDLVNVGRFTRFLPGLAKKEGLHLTEHLATRGWLPKAADVLVTGGFEGATEGAQQWGVNTAIQENYNPNQDRFEQVGINVGLGSVVGSGIEVFNQIMGAKVARRAHANANRVKGANSPEIPRGPFQDALGIRTVAGQQENSYIPQAEQPFLEKVSQVMYGKRLQDLPQGNAANLQRNIALMQQKGMTDPEILQYLSQDVDITAAPAAQSEPPPSRPAPLDLSNQPITLNDEGGFTSPYQDQPSLLDTIIAGGQQAPNYGEDIVAGMLNRRPRPGYPAPKPAMPDVRLTDEGTIIDPAKLPTKIRRGYPEPVKPPAEPANLFNTLPPVEPQQRMVFDPATDSYRVVSSEPPIAPDSLPPLPPVPYSAPVSTQVARSEAESTRLAKKQNQVIIPETGIPDAQVDDANQRNAREIYGKNYPELSTLEQAAVQTRSNKGLGFAVKPEELSDIAEFADKPFTRDQYRSALDIGHTARGGGKLLTQDMLIRKIGVPSDVAKDLMGTMVQRGEATAYGAKVNVIPGATGPKYSIQPAAAPATPATETVASLKDRLDDPPLLKRIYAATKRFGLEDRVSTRLVDNVRNPDGTLRTGTPGAYFEKIITLAMADPDAMESTLNHEMVHAIKEIGMLTDAEWTMLKTGLNPNAILDDNQREEYTKLYRGNQDMIHEEAIAIGIQKYMRGDIDLPPEIRSIVGQKLGFLENLGRIFRGEGHTTPETVMQSIADGTIGRRQYANQPKPNVQTGSPAAVPGAAGSSPKPKGAANIGDWVKANAPKEEAVDPKYSYVGSKAYSQDERESLQRASSKDVAIQMDAAGKSAKETRLATGWFKSPYDKVWKQEVTDHTSKLTEEFANLTESEIFGKKNEMRLDHVLDHPELFRAYPELRNVKVIKQRGLFDLGESLQGSFNPETNTLNITPYANDPGSVALHEIQHWIQEKEGFATGGNEDIAMAAMTPERMKKIAGEVLVEQTAELEAHVEKLARSKKALAVADRYRTKIDELRKLEDTKDGAWVKFVESDAKEDLAKWKALYDKIRKSQDALARTIAGTSWYPRGVPTPEEEAFLRDVQRANSNDIARAQEQLVDRQKEIAAIRSGDPETLKKIIKSSGGARAAYRSIAGEIEARDVQARQAYTPEERGATDPMSSESFDSDDVITIFGKNKSDSVEAAGDVAPVVEEAPLWEMRSGELSRLRDELKQQDRSILVKLFGKEDAKVYDRASRSNRDDQYSVVEKMEASLSEEQRNRLFGIGDKYGAEEVDSYLKPMLDLDFGSPASLGWSLQWAISRVGNKRNPAEMSPSEKVAYATIRHAFEGAESNGFDSQIVMDEALKHAASRFDDPADAKWMLERFAKKPAPTTIDRFQQAYNKLAEFDGQVVTAAAIQKEMGIADRAEFIKLLDELDRGKGIAADGSTLSLPASTGTKSATRGGASPVYQSGDTSFYGIRFHKPADAHLNEPRYSIDKSPDPDGLHAKIYGTGEKPPLLQRIKDFVQKPDRALKFRQALLNQNESVDRLSAKSEFHANPDTSSSDAIAMIKRAKEIAEQILLTGRGLIYGEKGHEVFRAIANSRLSPFGKDGWYTGITDKNKKRAFEITMYGFREEYLANTPNYTPGPNAAEAIAVAKELYANDADIREAVDRQSEFNDTMVDMALRGGVIDEATAKKFKDSRHFAFYRKTEDDYDGISGGNSGGSIGGRQNFKTIKGSDAKINDPIDNLVRNTHMIVDMAMKNVGKQKIARDAVNADAATVVPRAIAGETVPVRFDGKEYHFKITDKLLYESLNVAALPQGLLMDVGRGGSKLLRTAVTHTPVYLLNNAMRDSLQVWSQGYTTIPYLNIFTDYRKVKKGNAAYDDMIAHGTIGEGILGSGGDKEVDLHIKNMIGQGNSLHKAKRWMKERIAKSETLSRVTVYESVIKKGGTPAEARQQARELLNFDRHGANVGVRILSAFVPFQNARWQGTDALYRNATGSAAGDSARMARTMIARMAYLSIASALYTAVASTLDAWKKATQEERDQNWFIPIGNGNALRVPIPFELGLLTKIVPERTMAWMMGHDEGKEFAGALGRAVRETLKIDIIPQVIKPGLEAVANYDFYRGKAIENSADKRIERGYRAGDYTSELARIIGETTTLSPIQIDHMLKGYFGSSSVFATQIVDFALRDKAGPDIRLDDPTTLPLFGRMFQPQLGGKDIAAFYEMREAAEQAYATLMQHQKTGDALSDSERERLGKAAGIERGTRGADQQMAALLRVRKHLQASKQMTSTQRYDALKANKEAQDRVATQVLDAVKRAR